MKGVILMLLIKKFYEKGEYISPEDELMIYKDVTSLFLFWRDVVVKQSSEKLMFLNDSDKQTLFSIVNQLRDIHFNKEKTIGLQLDKRIVEILIWGSVISNRGSILEDIFNKTKNSIINYFHHELLVEGFLKLGLEEKAVEVIDLLFSKDHSAYMHAILFRYNKDKYIKYPIFSKKLVEYSVGSKAKILAKGERVDLKNISFDELLELVNQTKKFIK